MPIDAFEMAMVHRVFRRELQNAPRLIRDVHPGDVKRSRFVGVHLGNILSALHHHHAAEDELLWPTLYSRIPLRENEIRRMEDEHAGIALSVDMLKPVSAAWSTSADPTLAKQFIVALAEVSCRVDEHLTDEEHFIVPLVNEFVTADQWQKVMDRGASFVNLKNLKFGLVFAGLVLQEASPDERRRFLAGLPPPVRMQWKFFGKRIFAAYRTRLCGAPAW
jgi:hypothetical protein